MLGPLLPIAAWIVKVIGSGFAIGDVEDLVGTTGTVSMTLLALSLAATPIRIATGWKGALPLRKPLGLYAFGYGVLHLAAYSAEHGFDLTATTAAIFGQAYLGLGLAALAIMVPLALTSNRWSMRRLKKNWKRLQRWVYGAGLLAAVHTMLVGESFLGITMLLLLAVRLPLLRDWIATRRDRIRAVLAPG